MLFIYIPHNFEYNILNFVSLLSLICRFPYCIVVYCFSFTLVWIKWLLQLNKLTFWFYTAGVSSVWEYKKRPHTLWSCSIFLTVFVSVVQIWLEFQPSVSVADIYNFLMPRWWTIAPVEHPADHQLYLQVFDIWHARTTPFHLTVLAAPPVHCPQILQLMMQAQAKWWQDSLQPEEL